MRGDGGTATVVATAVAALLAVLGAAGAAVGMLLSARTAAVNAADAAALAAAPVTFRPFGTSGSPTQEAARLAVANGAELTRCACPVDRSWRERTVEVEVAVTVHLPGWGVESVRAVSRAEFRPVVLLTGWAGPALARGLSSAPPPGPEPATGSPGRAGAANR